MCGIFGSPNITPSVARMLPALAIAMEERGDEAWGASNGSDIVRHLRGITDSWASEGGRIEGWRKGIFHTRKASQGGKDDPQNIHPFSFTKGDGSEVIGIHNGCLLNHEWLNSTFNRSFTCDSMHIWKHRAEGQSWEDLDGWGALAWWEEEGERGQVLHLSRFNTTALKVVRLQGGEFLFASEALPLYQVAAIYGNPVAGAFETDEFFHYFFDLNEKGEMGFFKGEKLPFVPAGETSYGASTATTTTSRWNGHYTQGNWGRHSYGGSYISPSDSWCLCCNGAKVEEGKALICGVCMEGFLKDFKDSLASPPEEVVEGMVVTV